MLSCKLCKKLSCDIVEFFKMSEDEANAKESEDSQERLRPAVAMYGPKNLRGLVEGEVKMWCACGLSKKQPWCDGSHIGTDIKPLKWRVPRTQTLNQICLCKYTRHPPYCDGSHTSLPLERRERINTCTTTDKHQPDCKLCTGCGWVPDF